MNSVPSVFYDAVTRLLTNCCFGTRNRCFELSGLIGAVAAENNQKLAYEWIEIDGRFFETTYRNWNDDSVIALINSSYRTSTAFLIKGSLEEPSTDAIVAYRNFSDIQLYFYTSTINKQFVERFYSLRFVSLLRFYPGSADLIPGMMRNFVPRKTIASIDFLLDYVFDEAAETLLLDLLKQEQISRVILPAKSTSTLRRIIAEWKENSEKFIGKRVITQMKSDNKHYQAEVQAGRIRECTEDEKRFLKLYYPHPRLRWENFKLSYGWTGFKNPQISSNQKGGAIYWNRNPSENIELLFA